MAEDLMKTGEKILATYNKIPSTEIWNVENINTTLRQIEYYKETNVFESEDDILKIYDCLEKSIDYVELQAEAGHKINNPGRGAQPGAPFNLYINDFILGRQYTLTDCQWQKNRFSHTYPLKLHEH